MAYQQMPPANERRPRYQLIPRVLCFVTSGPDVLLLKGAPNKKIWAGKYNGLGGHVERGENVYAAAQREIREEAGIEIAHLRLRGVITIDIGDEPGIGLYVFTAQAMGRETTASAEGVLEWVPASQVAALDAVEDLAVLIRRVLGEPSEAAPFGAQYHYDAEGHLVMDFFSEAKAAEGPR